jgi:putative ABC transport system ATP-binding protein
MRIELRGVEKSYGSGGRELPVLRGVDLILESGRVTSILGPSGSGKTTLLGIMAGLDRPTRGSVILGDTDLTALTEDGRAGFRAAHVGFVFQTFHLLPSLTARENVQVPLELSPEGGTLAPREIRERAEALLHRVGLGDRGHHYPAQLSGGEQQRVALARAFVARPAILFADEPTGNLDRETGGRIVALLEELNREVRTTLVLVTHDLSLAERTDRILRIEGGRIVEDGGPSGRAEPAAPPRQSPAGLQA